jgi:hypothetical protein
VEKKQHTCGPERPGTQPKAYASAGGRGRKVRSVSDSAGPEKAASMSALAAGGMGPSAAMAGRCARVEGEGKVFFFFFFLRCENGPPPLPSSTILFPAPPPFSRAPAHRPAPSPPCKKRFFFSPSLTFFLCRAHLSPRPTRALQGTAHMPICSSPALQGARGVT